MIKLIAADMDGTLLNDKKELPKEFEKLCKKLFEKNIKLSISSGRSFGALRVIFDFLGNLADDFIYICDNGGNIILPYSEPIVTTIPDDAVADILKDCEKLEGVIPVLCCVNDIYYPAYAKKQFQSEINNFYINFSMVDNIFSVKDPVIKIAICDLKGSLENCYPVLNKKYGDFLNCVVSGKFWMDVMCKSVSKGNAVESIQKKYNITPEETMAFGDYFNDAPMLEKAYYSYVMDNACDEMKKYGRFIAPSNNENGVVKTICQILDITL